MDQIKSRLVINDNRHYNSDPERDADEKNAQNVQTIGIDIEMHKQSVYSHNNRSNETSQVSMPYDKYESLRNKREQSNSNPKSYGNRYSNNSANVPPYINDDSYQINKTRSPSSIGIINYNKRKRTVSSMNNPPTSNGNASHSILSHSFNNSHSHHPHVPSKNLNQSNSIPVHAKKTAKLYPIPSNTMTQTTTLTQYIDDDIDFNKTNIKNIQHNNTYYMVNYDDVENKHGYDYDDDVDDDMVTNITESEQINSVPDFSNDPQYKLFFKIMLDQSSSIGNESDNIAPLNVPNDMKIKSKYQQLNLQSATSKKLSPIVTPKEQQHKQHVSKRKSQSEMSESRKSSKSFVTLVEEKNKSKSLQMKMKTI